jgi:hypothetical protein
MVRNLFHLNFAASRLRVKQYFVPSCKGCKKNRIKALPTRNHEEPIILAAQHFWNAAKSAYYRRGAVARLARRLVNSGEARFHLFSARA